MSASGTVTRCGFDRCKAVTDVDILCPAKNGRWPQVPEGWLRIRYDQHYGQSVEARCPAHSERRGRMAHVPRR